MKRILIAAAALFAALSVSAQTAEDFKARYERQVRNMGLSGVGVETILDSWGEAFPEDRDMLYARFLFCFDKSKGSAVISRPAPKYLGQEPVMNLTDSTGKKVYYFQDVTFDDALYGEALKTIEILISKDILNLKYRFTKVAALKEFEKEDIVLTLSELQGLVAQNAGKPAWHYDSEPVDADVFAESVQTYCASIYSVGSESAYEAFKTISEMMLKQYPKESCFLDNLGSYWMMSKKNYKKALSYYNKALKINPSDQVAKTNVKIVQKKMAAAKK